MRGAGPAGGWRSRRPVRPPRCTMDSRREPRERDVRIRGDDRSDQTRVSLRGRSLLRAEHAVDGPVGHDELAQHAHVLRRVLGVKPLMVTSTPFLMTPGLKPLRTMPLGVPASKAQRSTFPLASFTSRKNHECGFSDGPGRSSPAR